MHWRAEATSNACKAGVWELKAAFGASHDACTLFNAANTPHHSTSFISPERLVDIFNVLKLVLLLWPCFWGRGIRQRLFRLAQEQDWAAKHSILIGARDDISGDYSDLLTRSKFCLVAPGQSAQKGLFVLLCSIVIARHEGSAWVHCQAHLLPKLSLDIARLISPKHVRSWIATLMKIMRLALPTWQVSFQSYWRHPHGPS